MKAQKRARVVIIGAGFGGIYTYLGLHKRLHGKGQVEITIVNDSDQFTFIPMIHEVATGTLLPSSITQPLRTLPQCCLKDFVEGCATSVDLDKSLVHVTHKHLNLSNGDGKIPAKEHTALQYDYLVLALGSETNFFNVSGAREHSLPLKSMYDARRVKNRVIDSFEHAEHIADPETQRDLLRFVIVGGGPTGIELAGEIADFTTKELAETFPKLRGLSSIVVIDRGAYILKQIDPWFRKKAEWLLLKKATVYHMHETSVRGVTSEGVDTNKGFVRSGMVVWAAGVRARGITLKGGRTIEREERSQRIKVNEYLQISSYKEVFVVGDQAWICDRERGQPYPMRAQFAVREGKVAAENIAASVHALPPTPFMWREKGIIISLGKGGALAKIAGIKFSGLFAWLIYRGAYLASIIGLRAKLRTALEWTLNLFLPRDVSKL